MHLRKTNLGGQRPAPVPGLGDQELLAEETVLRVSLRLSDRKCDWIQRGTENVSLPGLPGGGGSRRRTRLLTGGSGRTGKFDGFGADNRVDLHAPPHKDCSF